MVVLAAVVGGGADPQPPSGGGGGTHLPLAGWKGMGPGCAGPTSGVHPIFRLKELKDMVSNYQAYVIVGGQELWMNLDTAVATTWVMSAACATHGCENTTI